MDINPKITRRLREIPIKSQALAANLAACPVHDTINDEFMVLRNVIAEYAGLVQSTNEFLCELGHPTKNWRYIIDEAKDYALKFLHLIRRHPNGPEAAEVLVSVFLNASAEAKDPAVRADALDYLILFLERLSGELQGPADSFASVVPGALSKLKALSDELFLPVASGLYPLDKAVRVFVGRTDFQVGTSVCIEILMRYYRTVYDYWLAQEDPQPWLENETGMPVSDPKASELFRTVSHEAIHKHLETMRKLSHLDGTARLKGLLALPGYKAWVSTYRTLALRLASSQDSTPEDMVRKMIFLFRIIDIQGLARIHEEVLRQLNRTLGWILAGQDRETVADLVKKTFDVLKRSADRYPQTALDCIQSMGRNIISSDDLELADFFVRWTVAFGFQYPRVSGMNEDWQVLANDAHLKNIRVWLDLIKTNPFRTKRLLSALVINLALGGVFIRDTDLFPRDVTDLLNAEVRPVYNLVKQFARLLPVYFNDIGAEGELRDISTEMDEVHRRNDRLVHFLRKQTHVESSNLTVLLAERTLGFWLNRDKEPLRELLPPSIFDWIQDSGPYVDGAHVVLGELMEGLGASKIQDLQTPAREAIESRIRNVRQVSEGEKTRVRLVIRLYRLLFQKYNLGFQDFAAQLKPYEVMGFPRIPQLLKGLKSRSIAGRLDAAISYLETLQETILSPEVFPATEDIYRKRHIAVDIPSMYGSYHERKFDGLSLTFRLENMVNVWFEELNAQINLGFITHATFFDIYKYLKLFQRALGVDGITSRELDHQMELLSRAMMEREFELSQYIDVFNGLSEAVKKILDIHYHSAYTENLAQIIERMGIDDFLPKYVKGSLGEDRAELEQAVIEQFLRERIFRALAMQPLDNFLNRIRHTLYEELDTVPPGQARLLLSYDPRKTICPIHRPRPSVNDIIHLGNKGYNLVKLAALDVPVPQGFIITTEAFRCRSVIERFGPAAKDFRARIRRMVRAMEKQTGLRYGDPGRPLLLSVRSGAAVSQPGMMETFLNVGINENVAQGLATTTGNGWFAWDCYRRFLQSWGMSHELERDVFDRLMRKFKKFKGVEYKREFRPSDMRDLAMNYREVLIEKRVELPDDPYEQLFATIGRVLDSWDAPRASAYRRIMGMSDSWGTAVTVLRMIYGNLNDSSGSGVVFSHSPLYPGANIRLWGDFTLRDQGEDVVSGLVRTLPINRQQAKIEDREDLPSMDILYPEVYEALEAVVRNLVEDRNWGPQDIEFTFENPTKDGLHILQARDMGLREHREEAVFNVTGNLSGKLLARGLGVSGGAMSGRVVFSLEEIERWRKDEPETSLILLRSDTVPDDIKEIWAADGLLTARGGSTSHASIVAYRLGKTCVVGCKALSCHEDDRYCTLDGLRIEAGEVLSIDGRSGEVYEGRIPISAS